MFYIATIGVALVAALGGFSLGWIAAQGDRYRQAYVVARRDPYIWFEYREEPGKDGRL